MKGLKRAIKKSVTALVIFTGAIIFFCALSAFSVRLPRGAKVNGTDVGGLTYGAAKILLRERVAEDLKAKRLRICADERVYTFTYPEVDFADGLDSLLPTIRRGGEYFSPVCYRLEPREPYALFNIAGEPFTYYEGEDGYECDKEKLTRDILSSLKEGEEGGFADVRVSTEAVKRKLSRADIERRTQKLYSFTTYFDGDNTDRSENIRLAAKKINGTVIAAGGEFSFNGTVGARTEENGFRPAKIIEDGKFVLGYGGGVCQVSTTVYNAALLSGLEVTEYHPHSLQVGYVSPSRDAMVSGTRCDLKFRNNRLTPVYVRMNCTLSSVTCTVYGESDGYKYSFKSEVRERVPRPQAKVVDGDEDKIIYGRDGTKSAGYLVKSRNGTEEWELIRKDAYLAVADVLMKKTGETSEEAEG